jgi:protein-S-isoprenylcysteine O-methyltransferase Ste14
MVGASSKALFNQTWFNALRTVAYASGFLLFFGWLALALRQFDSKFSFALPHWIVPVGVVFMFGGGILALACISTFVVRGRGTPALFDPPREFVAIGPYRYVRNPMYVGGFLLLLGLSFYLRSISILLMSIVAVPAFHLLVVFHEEPSLRHKFGGPYEKYAARVHRWMPRAPLSNSSAATRPS